MSTQFHNVRNVSMWEGFKELFGGKKRGPKHPRPEAPPPQKISLPPADYSHLLINPYDSYAHDVTDFLSTVLNEQPLTPKQLFLLRLTKNFYFDSKHNSCYFNGIQLTGECTNCGFPLSSGKGISGHWGCPKCHR